MTTKKFNKEDLIELLDGDHTKLTLEQDNIVDQTRWSTIHELIFFENDSGAFYQTTYSCGSTEIQDESPFEYDPDEIECVEVIKQEEIVNVFVNAP
tara:strand:- start:509 stop:796 length:288 start_codon:yes stop_codon:yes gene_type:complete